MFHQAKRTSLAILIASAGTLAAWNAPAAYSQSPAGYGNLRPVPKMGTVPPATPAPAHNPTHDGWNLKWGRNPKSAPQPRNAAARDAVDRHFAGQDPFADDVPVVKQAPQVTPMPPVPQATVVARGSVTAQRTHGVADQRGVDRSMTTHRAAAMTPPTTQGRLENEPLQVATAVELRPIRSVNPVAAGAPAAANASIAQTTMLVHPQQDGGFALPPSQDSASPTPAPKTDFFEDPFGAGKPQQGQTKPRHPSLAPPSAATPERSSEPRMNQLRGDAGDASPSLPNAPSNPPSVLEPLPDPNAMTPKPRQANPRTAPADDGRSLREFLKDKPSTQPEGNVQPLPTPQRDTPDSPSDRKGKFENPFGERAADDRSKQGELERETKSRPGGREEDGVGKFDDADDTLKQTSALSCEDFRERIASQTIDKLSLDISPPFRPDVISESEYEKLKTKFDENQSERQWRSIEGRPLASGRLVDLAYEKVVVQTGYGTTEEISINKLSEADLAYISDNWGLPKECLIEQVAYTERSWQNTTMTWKASNLCHKPLYFEDVNLERYGHTRGPLWEPVVSSAHFFVNIAVLPYKMGVHAPNECQYALGYYRPGNCAPWIKPPVPISLRGGLNQAAVMTGAFWLIP